jgi:hypothetical protein
MRRLLGVVPAIVNNAEESHNRKCVIAKLRKIEVLLTGRHSGLLQQIGVDH